jgi:hypothetical protein
MSRGSKAPPAQEEAVDKALADPAARRRLARAIARALRSMDEEAGVREASRRSSR